VILREALKSALNPENSCHHYAIPCQSLEDWQAGKCINCPTGKCQKVGLLTDRQSRGIFYTKTLDQAIDGQFCGRSIEQIFIYLMLTLYV